MIDTIACLAIPGLFVALLAAVYALSNARSLGKRVDYEGAELRQTILTLSNRIAALEARSVSAVSTAEIDEPAIAGAVERAEEKGEAELPETTPAPAVPEPAGAGKWAVTLSSVAAQPAPPQPSARAQPEPQSGPVTPPAYKRVAADIQENPAVSWFTGTHIVVRVGIVILFFGVAFLLKYAADQGWLSIELRLAGAAVIGLALVAIGWRVHRRDGRRGYALTLQGGGLGILYMTTFTAFRIYDLLPAPLAFAILAAVSAATVALAVLNDSRALAILAVAGGFAAPFLVSTGEGSHIMLFSYVAVINVVILAVAWFKSWRELNLVGFAFTVAVGVLWGTQAYRFTMFRSVEFFLVLFVLFYTAVTILHAYRSPARMKDPIDGVLAFGVPVVAASFQSAMLTDWRGNLSLEMMAWSAVTAAVFYLAVGVVLTRLRKPNFSALGQVYAGIGALFAVLAVPFAFDADVTAAIWAAAGAGLIWLGLRHDHRYYRVLGGLTQVAAGGAIFVYLVDTLWRYNRVDLIDGFTFTGPVIAVAGIFSGYLFAFRSVESSPGSRFGEVALTVWGLVWWFAWGARQIFWYFGAVSTQQTKALVTGGMQGGALLLFFALSAGVLEWLGGRLRWPLIRIPAILLPIPVAAYLAAQMGEYGHVFAQGGWVAAPVALVIYYWMLYRHDGDTWQRFYHALGMWAIAFIGAVEAGYLASRQWPELELWTYIAWTVAPIVLVVGVSLLGRRIQWPIARHYNTYMTLGLGPIVVTLLLWLLWTTFVSDGSWQMAYIAVLNPLSVAQLAILVTALIWIRRLPIDGNERIAGYTGLAAFGFFWLTAEMARTVHHATGTPLELSALLGSELLQTGYSIVWTGLALVLMFSAKRRGLRWLWLIGAGLLGATVLKLFVVDLSNIGTLARIVSFLAVGALMLIIGYLAPIPPQNQKSEVGV